MCIYQINLTIIKWCHLKIKVVLLNTLIGKLIPAKHASVTPNLCTVCVFYVHVGHKIGTMNILESKKGLIDKDLQEMEKKIAPKYQQASKNMQTLKVSAEKHIQQSRTALMKQGESLHK